MQRPKPGTTKNEESTSAQQGLDKKRRPQLGEDSQASEVAGNKTAQKTEKMGTEICSLATGTEKGKEG